MHRRARAFWLIATSSAGALLGSPGCGNAFSGGCKETLTCAQGADAGMSGETGEGGVLGSGGTMATQTGGVSAGGTPNGSGGSAGSAGEAAGAGAIDAGAGGTGPTGTGGQPVEAGSGGLAGENAGGTGGEGTVPRCDVTKPFAPANFVPSLSSSTDSDATVSADGLTIYVWRGAACASAPPVAALCAAKRTTMDGSFGAPSPDPTLGPVGDWFKQAQTLDVPTISGDGLALYGHFGGQNIYNIFASQRALPTETFSAPAKVAELANVVALTPFISFDGRTLYFSSGGLQVATWSGTSFGTPKVIDAVASPAGSRQPVVSRDELTLYFESGRTDGTAKGGADIWASTRSDASEDFGQPSAVDELNTSDNEYPVWISPDRCEFFLIRGDHVLVARRPR